MVEIGLYVEARPDYQHKRLDSGFIVPDVSVNEIHQDLKRQVQHQIEFGVSADNAGYDYLFFPEQHFSLTGGVSPSPILSQTAVASRTSDIRLVQLSNILPWNDPVRLAEQTSMLDIISDGRVEVGVGRGSRTLEAETLGQYWGGTYQDQTKNRHSFREKFDILTSAWEEDLFSYHGAYHQIPPRHTEWESSMHYHYLADDASEYEPSDYMEMTAGTTTLKSLPVAPQPQQDPHPQIWRPTMSRRSIDWAARKGVNAVTITREFSKVKEAIDQYHDTAEREDWPDHRPEFEGEPFARGWDSEHRRGLICVLPIFNTDIASSETYERWKFAYEMAGIRNQSEEAAQPEDVEFDPDHYIVESDVPIVGSSESIADQLSEFATTCGYEDLMLAVQTNVHNITPKENTDQIEAFASDVMPHIREEFE